MKSPGDVGTTLVVMFASSQVEERTEEKAFSLTDLVADCGGILGLFIGFNFLMIFDLIFILFSKIKPYLKYK